MAKLKLAISTRPWRSNRRGGLWGAPYKPRPSWSSPRYHCTCINIVRALSPCFHFLLLFLTVLFITLSISVNLGSSSEAHHERINQG